MRKKVFLIIFIIVFVFWILYFITSLFISSNQKPSGVLPTPTKTEEKIPFPSASEDKIIISGVKTNNFLSRPLETNSEGDALIIRDSGYQITYLRDSNQFIINISTQSAGVRDKAESAFLARLGIGKEDACRLNVSVSSPYVPNSSLSVQRRTLSFCVDY